MGVVKVTTAMRKVTMGVVKVTTAMRKVGIGVVKVKYAIPNRVTSLNGVKKIESLH